ncbi:hypothetical protein OHA98_20160 [Streptomyces sp. NBC_00654]|uniref:hypothetical protein n=1 Tax=Streptomyces sp. NBC_00654 TaxID=2975799 RepID=UPI002259A317|nr:hypothetical protein [Streptomyces sp. NBC_00654]MCX4967077.1 hypothetical protein [Streptomyces sp. NBC_00654]
MNTDADAGLVGGLMKALARRMRPSTVFSGRASPALLTHMVTFYERNQIAGRGLDGAPQDGILPNSAEHAPSQ